MTIRIIEYKIVRQLCSVRNQEYDSLYRKVNRMVRGVWHTRTDFFKAIYSLEITKVIKRTEKPSELKKFYSVNGNKKDIRLFMDMAECLDNDETLKKVGKRLRINDYLVNLFLDKSVQYNRKHPPVEIDISVLELPLTKKLLDIMEKVGKTSSKKTKNTCVYLPETIVNYLTNVSEENKISKSEIIREALRIKVFSDIKRISYLNLVPNTKPKQITAHVDMALLYFARDVLCEEYKLYLSGSEFFRAAVKDYLCLKYPSKDLDNLVEEIEDLDKVDLNELPMSVRDRIKIVKPDEMI